MVGLEQKKVNSYCVNSIYLDRLELVSAGKKQLVMFISFALRVIPGNMKWLKGAETI